MIECRDLVKTYGGHVALDHIDLTVSEGGIVGLLGPNGSGKTTLMKILAGLLQPTAGSVRICGQPIGVESKKLVAYLPDKSYLSPNLTVEKQVLFLADFFEDFKQERAFSMLEELGVDRKAKIKTLSKGNQEKVSLILTMSRDAKVYLLDEPIAAVDPATRDYILRTILANYAENSVVFLSTHLISDVEQVLSEAIFLANGRIYLNASVDDIRERYHQSVDEYFRTVFHW